MTGVGITVVGVIGNGTAAGYLHAYQFMLVLSAVAILFMAILKVEPIDQDVR